MLKKFITYIKYYNEPKHSYVRDLAYPASCEYFRGMFCPSIDEQLAFQRAYISEFRHNYAKIKTNI